jgi:NAD-dependent deacetylase
VDAKLRELLAPVRSGSLLFITGAGVSAESGIPTFRGPQGYWTAGSRVYHPQELATYAAFARMPREVWRWYLYRRRVCRGAAPNPAHLALAQLECAVGERFRLITQNVDGLHLRAGNSLQRTYQVHGNVDYMRCAKECSADLFPIPVEADPDAAFEHEEVELDDLRYDALRCPNCHSLARPHVLWFDECYDELRFRFESSLAAAARADLLVTIGSSGATNLPNLVVQTAMRSGALVVDVNPEDNPFGRAAVEYGGMWIAESAGKTVPEIAAYLHESEA